MIKIIKGDSRHHNFILNSWLTQYFELFDPKSEKPRYAGMKLPFMKHETFWVNHEPLIKKCLERSTILVAINEEDPDQFIGYLVHEDKCVHFVYVKAFFRKQGISSALLNELGARWLEFSHISPVIWRTKKFKFSFNPYKFYKES
jgi:GNAT superfamily N-acetyltransferase